MQYACLSIFSLELNNFFLCKIWFITTNIDNFLLDKMADSIPELDGMAIALHGSVEVQEGGEEAPKHQ